MGKRLWMLEGPLVASDRPMVNVGVSRRNEAFEQRMRLVRLAQEFRVELAREIKRVARQFDHFHEFFPPP